MALESGPIIRPTKLSVASCIETLTQLNHLCNEKTAFHQKNLEIFKATFEIGDIRDIERYYPDPEGLIEPLARSAHYYSLTIQGPMVVLTYGTQELLKTFKSQSSEDIDHALATIQQSAFLFAKLKQNADKLLKHFLTLNPNIEHNTPNDKHKILLEKNCETISSDYRTLTELERICIEFFEMTLNAQDTFEQLDNFHQKLGELSAYLQTLTRYTTPLPTRKITQTDSGTPQEPFEQGLEVADETAFNSNTLEAQLARLQLNSSSDDDPAHWDALPSRSSSPGGLFTLYQTQQPPPAASPPSSSASIHTSDEKNRGFSHN